MHSPSRPSRILSVTERSGAISTSWNTVAKPGCLERCRAAARNRPPCSRMLAAVRPDDAGEQLDQRALARAVLAEDGVHGARLGRRSRRRRARPSRRSVWRDRRLRALRIPLAGAPDRSPACRRSSWPQLISAQASGTLDIVPALRRRRVGEIGVDPFFRHRILRAAPGTPKRRPASCSPCTTWRDRLRGPAGSGSAAC